MPLPWVQKGSGPSPRGACATRSEVQLTRQLRWKRRSTCWSRSRRRRRDAAGIDDSVCRPYNTSGPSYARRSWRPAARHLGRAKLQSGLAQKKGVFYAKVLQAAARRMDPTQNCSQSLRANGLSMTKYMERFGGYGQLKSIALIQWQVCVALDLAMSEQMDVLSLLCVGLEQCALDNGSVDVGYLLSLQEEPPASIMSNRSLMSVGGRNRVFAPLADQWWVTTSLAFFWELDLITLEEETSKGEVDKEGEVTSRLRIVLDLLVPPPGLTAEANLAPSTPKGLGYLKPVYGLAEPTRAAALPVAGLTGLAPVPGCLVPSLPQPPHALRPRSQCAAASGKIPKATAASRAL